MQMIGELKPSCPTPLIILLFHYLNWNCWENKNMINFVNSFWPLKPGILNQVSIKAAMDSCATETPQNQNYCILKYHTFSEVNYVPWRNHHKLAEHHGVTQMHVTLQKTYYWPKMVADATSAVQDCVQCPLSRVCLH